jgi:hypothetical protein
VLAWKEAKFEEVIEKEGVRPMDFTRKIVKGFVYALDYNK